MGWVTDIIRELLWMISYALLVMGDAIFDITQSVGSIRISQYEPLWKWWGVLATTIAFITAIRVVLMVLKYMLDDDYQQKTNIFSTFSKVLLVSMVIALLPIGVQTVTDAGASAIKKINTIVATSNTSSDIKPSTIIISSIVGHSHQIENNNGTESISIYYKISDIEINNKNGDKYIYFDTLGDLFMLLIMGAFSSIMFILIGIQIAQRLFSLMMKVLVAPIPISGLVNPDDSSFQRWYRMIISDVVSNFAQLLLVNVVMVFSVSNMVRDNGVWVTLVVFLGGIMVCLTGIPELSSLIGGDTSTSGVMQQLASIRQASSGFGRSVVSTGKTLGNVAKKGLSGATNIGKRAGGVGKGIVGAGIGFAAAKMPGSNSSSFTEGFTGGSSERRSDKQGNVFSNNSTTQTNSSQNKNNQEGSKTNLHESTSVKGSKAPNNTFNQKPKEQKQSKAKENVPNKNNRTERSSNIVQKADRKYGTKANPFVKQSSKGGSHVYKSSMNYKTKNTSTQRKVLKSNEVSRRSSKVLDKKFKGDN